MEKGAVAYCACGKRIFLTRKDAKAYKKVNPKTKNMRVYECENYGMRDSAPYHFTAWAKEDYNSL